MKKFMIAALAAGMLTACSDSAVVETPAGGGAQWGADGTGYVSLNISLPSSAVGRANDQFDDGLASEYKVKDAVLVLFKGATEDAAKSGIAAAVVLGVGRAIGEAMAIIMVSGNVANLPGLLTSVRFMTTAIASEMAYAAAGSLQQQALFSIGLVLFLFIMMINVFLNVFVKGRRTA